MEMTKEQLELQHSQEMNEKAIERIRQQNEEQRTASVFFEDDEKIMLRNGQTYNVSPCTLKEARKLMNLLKTVNIEAIILNFVPDEESTNEKDLFDILLMAFKNYPEIDKEFVDANVDLNTAKKIIETLIGLNGLKK